MFYKVIFGNLWADCTHTGNYIHDIIRIQWLVRHSGGSRNFRGGGRGRIFRSGGCFDAPSHIPYLFVARVVNKINNVNFVS